ncbi:MAG: MFS transporter, partial [Arthrobacter sp.]
MTEQEPARQRAVSAPDGGAGLREDAPLTSTVVDDGAAARPTEPDTIDTTLRSPAQRSRTFAGILVNTALANITTSYLWFALTFWVYLETRNVIATGVI